MAASGNLLVKAGNDYSAYFATDTSLSVSKLEEFLEESSAKLDELSCLFAMNEAEARNWLTVTLPPIILVSEKAALDIRKRIDTFRQLIDSITTILDKVEVQISQAEQAYGSSSSFRSVLNYFRKPELETPSKVPFEPISFTVQDYFAHES